ncbi:MAG TPA: hypothetical protein VGD35_16295 [Chitinophaga sp.]
MVRSSDSVGKRVDEYRLFEGDSSAKHIWFMVYDSRDKMPKDSNLLKRFPDVYGSNFCSTWGKGFGSIKELKDMMADDWILVVDGLSPKTVSGYPNRSFLYCGALRCFEVCSYA